MNYYYENRSKKFNDAKPISTYVNYNFSYMAHWHTEIEIAYVESGNIFVSINNDKKILKAGDIAICNSGDIHYYEQTDSDSKIILIIFKPEFFGFTSNWLGTYKLNSPFLESDSISIENFNKIKDLIYYIFNEDYTKDKFYDLFIKSKIIELTASILRYVPITNCLSQNLNKSFSKLETMQNILTYIENNFTDDISLQDLANKFNMDSSNLSTAFNSIAGCNLRTYINTLRITKAESIILNSKKPLIDIAFECGFNSIRTFNRAYKSVKGIVPSSNR